MSRYVPGVPHLELPAPPGSPSPHLRVHYRERGAGPAVVILHGGWGHEAYPFDAAIARLAPRHRVIVPDRVGYGGSGRWRELPDRFHQRMAEETVLLLDALGIRSAALWGHSDGAVIAAWTALLFPDRVSALVLEALHFFAAKPRSVDFFETGVAAPESFGARTVEALERDHGPRWREVVAAGGRAWLRIIAEGRAGRPDLYDGRLAELRAPALLLHGRSDPRTEPGEVEAALRALPHARVEWLDAGHSPHTGTREGARCVALAAAFLQEQAAR